MANAFHEVGFKQNEESHDFSLLHHHEDSHISCGDGISLLHLNTMPAGPWWKEHLVKSTDTLQVSPQLPLLVAHKYLSRHMTFQQSNLSKHS